VEDALKGGAFADGNEHRDLKKIFKEFIMSQEPEVYFAPYPLKIELQIWCLCFTNERALIAGKYEIATPQTADIVRVRIEWSLIYFTGIFPGIAQLYLISGSTETSLSQ
jgi:hypothetical protein